MTSRDRAELQVAAVIGAVLGGVTGYLLSNLVESGGWLKILIWALIGAVVVTGMVFVFGLFVRECFPSPLPAAVFILIHLLLSARAVEGMAIPSRPTKLMRGS
jgi:FtsH-binding integral membrane protein